MFQAVKRVGLLIVDIRASVGHLSYAAQCEEVLKLGHLVSVETGLLLTAYMIGEAKSHTSVSDRAFVLFDCPREGEEADALRLDCWMSD